MEKLQSTFKNMILSLVTICIVAAGALAGVYILTEKPIKDAMTKKQQDAIMQVLPEVSGDIRIADAEENNGVVLYKAYVGEDWIGTAVEASTEGNNNMPFGGTFRLMVGFDKEGNVVRYVVLEQAETPGLGALMSSWFCNPEKPKSNILGKNPATTNFSVSKDGGDIDAITASTITSRAFLEVIVKAYNGIAQQPMPIEAVSGATQQAQCDKAKCDKCEKQCDKAQCDKAKCDKCEKQCKKAICKQVKEMEVSNE